MDGFHWELDKDVFISMAMVEFPRLDRLTVITHRSGAGGVGMMPFHHSTIKSAKATLLIMFEFH